MPDNVTIANGSLGTFDVLADDVGGEKAQVVKLAVSGDGDGTLLPADTANGMDVDVTRVTPGVTSTALGKAEDAPHSSGDTGVMVLAVRNDVAGSLSSTTGDYTPLQTTSTGDLRVSVTGGAGAGTEFAEDAPHTSGDKGTVALAVRNDAKTSLVSANGDYGTLQLDANGHLIVVGQSDLYGPSEETQDDPLPTTPTGPVVMTRRASALTTTAPADGDAQALASNQRGALYVALDLIGSPVGDAAIGRGFSNVAGDGASHIVIAGVAGKKIRVHQLALVTGGVATNITFQTHTGAAAISPLFSNDVHGGEVLPFTPMGWFETGVGDSLDALTSSGGSPTGVLVGYSLV